MPRSHVEAYNQTYVDIEYSRNGETKPKHEILVHIYCVNFVLATVSIPILIVAIYKLFNKNFNYGKQNRTRNCSTQTGTQTGTQTDQTHITVDGTGPKMTENQSEVDNAKKKAKRSQAVLTAAAVVSLLFFIAAVITDCHVLTKSEGNVFTRMKLAFTSVFIVINFLMNILLQFLLTEISCAKRAGTFFIVGSITSLTGIVLLSFIPTILHVFVYPVDTSALIVLNITLFYSMTIFFAIVIYYAAYLRESSTFEKTKLGKFMKEKNPSMCCLWVVYLVVTSLLLALMAVTYVTFILMFQFAVSRNENTIITIGTFSKYLPIVAIILITYLLNKGTSFDAGIALSLA